MSDDPVNESARYFIEGYFSLWSGRIQNADFMEELLLFCFRQKLIEELHEISFTAKYITGLHRVLIDASKNPEVKDTSAIENDISGNLQKIIARLKTLLEKAPEPISAEFEEMTRLTRESFERFYSLLTDLDFLKQYFNLLMRESEKQVD
jgi:hypothetical protein